MPLTKEEWNALKPTLRMLWAEGMPTKDIAARMGLTKNAVIGAAHRLDLPPRESPIIRDPERIASAEGRREKKREREAARRAERSTLPPLKSVAEVISTPPEDVMPIPEPIVFVPGTTIPFVPHAGRDHRIMMAVGKANALAFRGPTLPPIAATPPPTPDKPRPFARVRECAWPIGDPGTPTYRTCDAPAAGARPYCGEHCAVAYVRVGSNRGQQDTYEMAHTKGARMATMLHQTPLTRPIGRNILDED